MHKDSEEVAMSRKVEVSDEEVEEFKKNFTLQKAPASSDGNFVDDDLQFEVLPFDEFIELHKDL